MRTPELTTFYERLQAPQLYLERAVTRFLDLVKLNKIRSKILVFSLVATLIPSFSMGWMSYRNNRLVIEEKVSGELIGLTSHTVSVLDFWLRERRYEVKIFSNSVEVKGNLGNIYLAEAVGDDTEAPFGRLVAYLEYIGERFADYKELLVVDLAGNPVASSFGGQGMGDLPEGWLDDLQNDEPIFSGYHWDKRLGEWVVLVGEPVSDIQNDAPLGVIVAKLGFHTVSEFLETSVPSDAHEIYLINPEGLVLTSSLPLPAGSTTSTLAPTDAARLFAGEGTARDFDSFRGNEVVGVLQRMSALGWGIVAHMDREEAYAQIAALRNKTLMVILGITVAIGLAAYLLGMTIVKPLNRLTAGAADITAGDLDISLPVYSRGELGKMTVVFNRMATRLRTVLGELDDTNKALLKKNDELHQLSITDPLTGLNNRLHMMETLEREGARAARYNHPYSILMVDIDGFKRFNDTYGHLAGDEVLKEVSATLKRSLRGGDYAARYGGEEFLVLLPETGPNDAAMSAERLRQRVETTFGVDENSHGITVSVGVASYPANGSGPEEVLIQADTAMYSAKRAGRNQVEVAKGKRKAKKKAAG